MGQTMVDDKEKQEQKYSRHECWGDAYRVCFDAIHKYYKLTATQTYIYILILRKYRELWS